MSGESKGAAAGLAALPVLAVAGVAALLLLFSPGPDAPDAASCGAPAANVDQASLPAVVGRFDEVQVRNAAIIRSVVVNRKMPEAATAVAIMTAIQESDLRNLANRGEFQRPATSRVMTAEEWVRWRQVAMLSLNYPHDGTAAGDWDSVGMFQGRPQAGWGGQGTPEEMVQNLLNPAYTAGRFLDGLAAVDGWQTMPAWKAAQTVQRSAFPMAYADHWDEAQQLAAAVAGGTVSLEGCTGDTVAGTYPGLVSESGWAQPIVSGRYTGGFGDIRSGYVHQGSDFAAPLGSPIYAAADGIVISTTCKDFHGRSPCNLQIDHGVDEAGKRVSTLYVHMFPGGTLVEVGQTVIAGQHVANVGNNGNSTGPHLHFEVWIDGEAVNALTYMRSRGIELP